MISGQRQSPEAVGVPVCVVVLPAVVVPKLVEGQMQGVVDVEVEVDSGVRSCLARLLFHSWSGSGVFGCSNWISIVFPESSVVLVQVGFVGPLLISSSEFDSFSSIVRGIVCVDNGCFVSPSSRLFSFVLTYVGFVLTFVGESFVLTYVGEPGKLGFNSDAWPPDNKLLSVVV